jgi:hypothetical protein
MPSKTPATNGQFILQTAFAVQGKVVIMGAVTKGRLEVGWTTKSDDLTLKIASIEVNRQNVKEVEVETAPITIGLGLSGLTIEQAQVLMGKELTFK